MPKGWLHNVEEERSEKGSERPRNASREGLLVVCHVMLEALREKCQSANYHVVAPHYLNTKWPQHFQYVLAYVTFRLVEKFPERQILVLAPFYHH